MLSSVEIETPRSASLVAVAGRILRLVILCAVGYMVFDWLVLSSVTAPATYAECRDAGGACIAFLQDKWRLILFGLYPYDQQWRAAIATILILGLVATFAMPVFWQTRSRRRTLAAGSVACFALIWWLLFGGFGLSSVPLRNLSGLPMTLFMASVGLSVSFVLAILLALGRKSDMPLFRWICTGYIEFIRAIPLISALFLAVFVLPIVLPSDWDIPPLLRAIVAYVMFFSAYMAENIRGGLQALPLSQYAAAKAIGMTYWQAQKLVILPQAIRISLPSLINTSISGLKDTSLVMVVSMLDLLGTANAAKADANWQGLFLEAYLFVGIIYIMLCASMSYYGRWIEKRLQTGQRDTKNG